jgi:hypothetical protein
MNIIYEIDVKSLFIKDVQLDIFTIKEELNHQIKWIDIFYGIERTGGKIHATIKNITHIFQITKMQIRSETTAAIFVSVVELINHSKLKS